MSHPINAEVYEKILKDEGFLNDLWNKFDATTKVGILEQAGVNVFEEYAKVSGTAEEHE